MNRISFSKSLSYLIILWFSIVSVSAQVSQKIGNNSGTINPNAVLELESTTQGFLPPRMTAVQMAAITTPTSGMIVFCSDCGSGSDGELRISYSGVWQTFKGNLTGNISGNAATVSTNANLTGAITSTGNATSLGSFTSANLASAITDETGTGKVVMSDSPTFTGTVSGIDKTMVGLANVDNTTDLLKPISTATQTALDDKLTKPIYKVALGYLAGTGQPDRSIAIGSNAGQNSQASEATAIGFAAGQFNQGLNAVALGSAAGNNNQAANSIIINAEGSANPLNASTEGFFVAPVRNSTSSNFVYYNTATKEISYGGITAAMVGLNNVDNTTDLLKPISTATQTALDLKANLASPTFSGTPTAPTATAGTNTTQLATTAFVTAATAASAGVSGSGTLNYIPKFSSATAIGNSSISEDGTGLRIGNPNGQGGVYTGLNTDNNTRLMVTGGREFESIKMAFPGDPYNNELSFNWYNSAWRMRTERSSADITDLSFWRTAGGVTTEQMRLTSQGNLGIGTNSPTEKLDVAGNVRATGTIKSAGFKTPTGTSSQFLKADGSVDSSTYLTSAGTATNVSGIVALANGGTGSATQNFVDLTTDQTVGGNKTFTGTTSGITAAMVGLGNVTNTSDANKIVSTATQAALDLKANIASPTFTGTPTLPTGTTGVTQTAGNSSTALATTAFVAAANATNANLTGMVTSNGNATTVVTNANLTGVVTSTGNATAIANGAITNVMLANGAVANLSGTNTGDQTNITGNAATVTTNANLTGPITSSGNTTSVASQTGTGSTFVMNTSPILVTPNLGTPSAVTLTNATGLPLTAGVSGILPVANGGTGLSSVGTNGQVLTTNGSGVASWATPFSVSEADEQVFATAAQTSFTLTQTPASTSKVKMYVNGIKINKLAYSVSGTTVTYVPANNNNYAISLNDRVQFEYTY